MQAIGVVVVAALIVLGVIWVLQNVTLKSNNPDNKEKSE